MRRIMITAMESGSGKTVLTCGLLLAWRRRGLSVAACKCGPDYIDPMFHRRASGAPSHNLDRFLQGSAGVRRIFRTLDADIAVIEGGMGYFDGVNGTEEASAWQLASEERIPVILAVRPQGSSLTLAAQIRGIRGFRTPDRLAGIFLSECRPALYAHLKPVLERETGLPVVGWLPPMEEARLDSRHLGLVTAAEVSDLEQRFTAVADRLEETTDLALLWELSTQGRLNQNFLSERHDTEAALTCRIAVARDEAFCFYYEESLAALRACGAELEYFSPLHDPALPPHTGGLYLGGGYPELYARELSRNTAMRDSIRAAVADGMPTVAECGGFLYLQQELEDREGHCFPMVGALPGRGFPTAHLVRFGYACLCAEDDSLLFRAGDKVPVHEFHYWDSTEIGTALTAEKPSGRTWRCGMVSPALYAAFPHLHLDGELPLAERFAEAAGRYGEKH